MTNEYWATWQWRETFYMCQFIKERWLLGHKRDHKSSCVFLLTECLPYFGIQLVQERWTICISIKELFCPMASEAPICSVLVPTIIWACEDSFMVVYWLFPFSLSPNLSVTTVTQDRYDSINATESRPYNSHSKQKNAKISHDGAKPLTPTSLLDQTGESLHYVAPCRLFAFSLSPC